MPRPESVGLARGSANDLAGATGGPDRPGERLRSLGSGALANRELLAILVGGGSARPALDVADRLLRRVDGSLRRLASLPPGSLNAVPGVGRAGSARILAALELGRRSRLEAARSGDPVRGPGDVYARMDSALRDLRQEEFHALLLNTQHRVLRTVFVTRGLLDTSLVHPREVFRHAIAEGAAAVILVHNHPSGDPEPSPDDRAVTSQLTAAGRAVGIPVLDHIVVGDGRYVSMAERGWV